jgi:hypothetical protein
MNAHRLIPVLAAAAFIALVGSVTAPAARAAAPEAEVEALQMPAWLTRDGKRVPVEIMQPLRVGDVITTGEGARIVLKLAEGSTVKLGENARFEVSELSHGRNATHEPFKATLGVREGAFRFTTAPGAKKSVERAIDVRFATVTASITGTDLWGKSGIDREIVALIEGEVTVKRDGDTPVKLDKPKTEFVAEKDGPSRPVSAITLARLEAYARETEMQPGAGGAGRGGNWKVYAARTPNEDEAVAVYEKLRDAGFASTITQRMTGKKIYQVAIAGLLSESDGVSVAAKLRIQLGLQDVSVSLN